MHQTCSADLKMIENRDVYEKACSHSLIGLMAKRIRTTGRANAFLAEQP